MCGLAGQVLTRKTPQLLPRRLKVLVAEDNAANRRLFEEQLKRLACDAVLAEDDKRAIAWLSRQIFGVLVTDPSMPEMDGYALAREARKRWPVMAATTATTPEERKRCTALEARIRSGGLVGLAGVDIASHLQEMPESGLTHA